MARFRPRFSIRTLVILITLICCCAACWGPTKKYGVPDVVSHQLYERQMIANAEIREPSAVMPFVVRAPWISAASYGPAIERCDYYFWFFGYVAKLPWERKLSG